MRVSFFSKGTDCLVTKVTGELDHHVAKEIRNETDTRIIRGRVKNLIFDFTDLSFMDSSGIGVVIGRYKLIKSGGGGIAIVSNNVTVNKILNISGVTKIINVYGDLTEVPDKI